MEKTFLPVNQEIRQRREPPILVRDLVERAQVHPIQNIQILLADLVALARVLRKGAVDAQADAVRVGDGAVVVFFGDGRTGHHRLDDVALRLDVLYEDDDGEGDAEAAPERVLDRGQVDLGDEDAVVDVVESVGRDEGRAGEE